MERRAYEDGVDTSKYLPVGFVEYKLGQEPQELLDFLAPTAEEVQASLIAHFKSLYLGVVDAKLKELDYDSLATVKLWEGDVQFGDEASNILEWYKSIISYNYALLNSGVVPTDEEYLDGMPTLL